MTKLCRRGRPPTLSRTWKYRSVKRHRSIEDFVEWTWQRHTLGPAPQDDFLSPADDSPDISTRLSLDVILHSVGYGLVSQFLSPFDTESLMLTSKSVYSGCTSAVFGLRKSSKSFLYQLENLPDQISNWRKNASKPFNHCLMLRDELNDLYVVHPLCTAGDLIKQLYNDKWMDEKYYPMTLRLSRQFPSFATKAILNRADLSPEYHPSMVSIDHPTLNWRVSRPKSVAQKLLMSDWLHPGCSLFIESGVDCLPVYTVVEAQVVYNWEVHQHARITSFEPTELDRIRNPLFITPLATSGLFADRFPLITRYIQSGKSWLLQQNRFVYCPNKPKNRHESDEESAMCEYDDDLGCLLPVFELFEKVLHDDYEIPYSEAKSSDSDSDFKFETLFNHFVDWLEVEIKFSNGRYLLYTEGDYVYFDSLYKLFYFADWYYSRYDTPSVCISSMTNNPIFDDSEDIASADDFLELTPVDPYEEMTLAEYNNIQWDSYA